MVNNSDDEWLRRRSVLLTTCDKTRMVPRTDSWGFRRGRRCGGFDVSGSAYKGPKGEYLQRTRQQSVFVLDTDGGLLVEDKADVRGVRVSEREGKEEC